MAGAYESSMGTTLIVNHFEAVAIVPLDQEGIVFVAEGLKHGTPEFDETEDLQIRKLPLTEALEMVGRGDITDAISVAALLHVANARKSFWR